MEGHATEGVKFENKATRARGRDPQFEHELPSIQGVEEVDETWTTGQ